MKTITILNPQKVNFTVLISFIDISMANIGRKKTNKYYNKPYGKLKVVLFSRPCLSIFWLTCIILWEYCVHNYFYGEYYDIFSYSIFEANSIY